MYSKKLKVIFFNNYKFHKYNSCIHIDFIKKLESKFDIVEYGLRSKKFKNTLPFGSLSEFKRLFRDFEPNLFLSYNSNGSNPGKRNHERYAWMEGIYKLYDIPKFHFTVDFCRDGFTQEETSWFKKMGIQNAIFRHKNYLKTDLNVKSFWVPFSVDREMFERNYIPFEKKKDGIGFVGSLNHEVYKKRKAAVDYLSEAGLISRPNKKVILDQYVRALSNFKFGLTCGGTTDFFVAKYLEIPASGSILVCTETDGFDSIRKYVKHIVYDPNNMGGFLEEYLDLSKDPKNKKYLAESRNYILVKHCHEKRVRQFYKLVLDNI